MKRLFNTPTFHRGFLWTRKHRVASLALFGILSILLVSIGAWYAYAITKPFPVTFVSIPVKKPEPPKFYSPLTGIEVPDENATRKAVTAIMIENSPSARPHSGLKQAGVVYEAIAEAGITRYLALYQESKPELIGPVRSLRTYFMEWAAPYNASIAHVGGNAKSLSIVRNGQYRDIDQFFNSSYYWRASDRRAPHNVYTSFKKLDALNQKKGFTTSSFTGFLRIHTDEERETANKIEEVSPYAKTITINFLSKPYNTRYTYDSKTRTYSRFLAGAPHLDREQGQIAPNVVVVLHVNERTVLEDGWRESITTTGKGKATIFQNGRAITATWTKDGRDKPLRLVNADGKDIMLVPGQTWIAAVPGRGSVSWQK